jgi:hypothetical protein
MLIDKINMYYKSSKKLQFKFTKEEQSWVDKIDNIKTFTDVLKIAKQLYGYQEKQLEQLSKLPDFDNHPLAKNYKLDKNGKKIQVQNSEKIMVITLNLHYLNLKTVKIKIQKNQMSVTLMVLAAIMLALILL